MLLLLISQPSCNKSDSCFFKAEHPASRRNSGMIAYGLLVPPQVAGILSSAKLSFTSKTIILTLFQHIMSHLGLCMYVDFKFLF